MEIADFLKSLALKNDKKNKTNEGSKVCSADRKKKWCKSILNHFSINAK